VCPEKANDFAFDRNRKGSPISLTQFLGEGWETYTVLVEKDIPAGRTKFFLVKKQNKKEIVLILHDIRSTHNVGSIFRTADALGVKKIYLTGYTPTPVDSFGRVRKDIAKTALGAEKNILWEHFSVINPVLKKLKKDKFSIIALEQSSKSIDYKKIKPLYPVAVILGNEVLGISPKILKKCDLVMEIPMQGKKESLNVSVATGVALFRIFDR